MAGIQTRRVRFAVWAILLLGSGLFFPCPGVAGTTFFPETDIYLTHNNIFRSRFIAGGNWSDTTSQWSSGYFEYSLDFGMLSFFRRYVFRDPNSEKGKLISFRFGYAYLPDFQSADSDSDEHRGVMEMTLRLPMGGKWLWTDRNKGDLRWFGEEMSTRYRNRLKLERGIAFLGFRGTPYTSVEGYYDTAVDQWNLVEARLGVEVPWKQSTVFETYFTHQMRKDNSPSEVVGFVIQKHLAMPIGGTQ